MKTTAWFWKGLLASLVAVAFSCKQSTHTGGEKSDSLTAFFNQGLRATDTTWTRMLASDDLKIENLKRLCRELSLLNGSDEKEIAALLTEIEQLPLIRYTRDQVRLPGVIDRYDSLTNEAIRKTSTLARKLAPNQEYQLINQLLSEIRMADDSVLFYRKDYDRSLDQLKERIRKNEKALRQRIPQLDSIIGFGVFRAIP